MTEKEFAEQMERNERDMAACREPDDGGSAFPRSDERMPDGTGVMMGSSGMTLRDWFAGQALSGMLHGGDPDAQHWEVIAAEAFKLADAIIRARQRKAE